MNEELDRMLDCFMSNLNKQIPHPFDIERLYDLIDKAYESGVDACDLQENIEMACVDKKVEEDIMRDFIYTVDTIYQYRKRRNI